MLHLDSKRLRVIEPRSEHVARAVLHKAAVQVLDIGDQLCAAVVHLQLLNRLNVVVNEHFAARADDRAANLRGGEPIHVEVGKRAASKFQRHVRDVLVFEVDVPGAQRGDRFHRTVEQIEHHGNVVGRQIPDHVDVALEDPEVDASRVVVVDVPHFARVEVLFHLLDGAGEEVRVIDRQDAAGGAGGGNHPFGVAHVRGQRLFDKDMLAPLQRFQHEGAVRVRGRRDEHRVDRWIGQQFVHVGRQPGGGIGAPGGGQPRRIEVGDRYKLNADVLGRVAREVWPPVPVARDPDTQEALIGGGSRGARRTGGAQRGAWPSAAAAFRTPSTPTQELMESGTKSGA